MQSNMDIDLDQYSDMENWRKNSRHLIMSEIKKNNEVFYDKWCDHEDNC